MSNSSSGNNRKKGKQPGTPKTGGRKAGTPNKKTYWLRQVLEENDFDWGKDFATSMRVSDYERVKILIDLLPYLNPKIDPKPLDDDDSDNDININVNLSSLV
jgi:hypothetical protein